MTFTIKSANIQKGLGGLRDTFAAGVIFLLPVLILLVLMFKIEKIFENFTVKLAAFAGLKDVVGIPASTIVVMISFIVISLVCGYLMRIVLLKHFTEWMDSKLRRQMHGEYLFPEQYPYTQSDIRLSIEV